MLRIILIRVLTLARALLSIKDRWRLGRHVTPAEMRIVSGQSWNEFCDAMKAAGAVLKFPGAPQDAFNQAEGYRYLARLTRAGLEAFLECSDARAPVLSRLAHETVKLGSDNPDNVYQNATISGQYAYVIRGTRGSVNYLGIGVQKGQYGQDGGMKTTAYIDADALKIGEDGLFELYLSAQRGGYDNWLPIDEHSTMVIVRQTFGDRNRETAADLRIERIGGDGLPSPVTAEAIDKGLNTAGLFVAGASLMFANWVRGFQKNPNVLTPFDHKVSTAAGGDPNICYFHNYWMLDTAQALVIEFKPPVCDAWNFQLDNHWMESLDYRYFNIHVNQKTAVYRPDGSVRIVVAHRNPGRDNWIDTAGHLQGAMTFRWIKASEHPVPATRVISFDCLAELP